MGPLGAGRRSTIVHPHKELQQQLKISSNGFLDDFIGFKSLQEQIDTTTNGGKLVFHVFGALAECEPDLIRERTQAGLLAARARRRQGGRPRALDPRKAQIAQALYHDKTNAIPDICRTLHISRATLYRYVKTGTGELS